ncbi:MAG: DUF3999 family protein [Acidobacteria bacterium]|nr:DUF3999 family protein [Acidobacteriota bacterium]
MRSFLCLLLCAASAAAQDPETLTHWPFYQQLEGSPDGRYAVELDHEALGGSRTDQADLRLYDASGREVPYALRVRRRVLTSDIVEARELNRSTRGETALATLDLGDYQGVHNEVELDLAGGNFRRSVAVEGSDDGQSWATLTDHALVFRFSSSGRSVDERRVRYPDSRYRYLRVLVSSDPAVDGAAPTIREVKVRLHTEAEGVERQYPQVYPIRQPTRENGRPASEIQISMPGAVPIDSLALSVGNAPFSRPYRLLAGGPDSRREIASGVLASDEQGATDRVIRFEEAFAKELTLRIIDDRNPPLDIYNVTPAGAARQVVFDSDGLSFPLRLYYGNLEAAAPNYDYDSRVPAILDETPPLLYLEPRQDNPDYRPPQPPVTERAPWLIYVVLGAAALALLWLLRGVIREASRAETKPGDPA